MASDEQGNKKVRFEKAWGIYFWFSLALFAVGLGADARETDETRTNADLIIYVIGLVVETITLVGLYAFISQVALGRRLFWAAFFFASLGYLIWSMADVFISDPTVPEPLTFWVTLFVLSLALLTPQFVALFLYAFRSQKLWAPSP